MILSQEAAHSFAQTADDGMLLTGDDLTALLGSLENQFFVQRLDGGYFLVTRTTRIRGVAAAGAR